MTVRNYGDGWYGDGRRYLDAWPWVVAIDAYDFGAPEPLAELMATEAPPEELRPVIAAIVTGKRKPNLKAAAKLKIPAGERLQIAGAVSTCLGVFDDLKRSAIDPEVNDEAGVRMLAERAGETREPAEILRYLEAKARKTIEWAAREAGVSTESLEDLLRHLRKKIEHYPDV